MSKRPSEFFFTIGDESQLLKEDLFTGIFMKGRREPRIAFVGRSNVGKSSLINAIVEAKLAQVSKEPGKTRSIHLYSWFSAKKIVADLPGYGYARVSADERDRWAKFIESYLRKDPGLERAVVLLDARHGPTEVDLEAIGFLSFLSVPITFVFSKADQLKTQSERARRKKEVDVALRELGHEPKNAFWVSARTGDGIGPLTRELRTEAPPTVLR